MPKVIASIKALIKDQNKYLILKAERNNMVYRDLPGGKIKYGEGPFKALKREINEETNLEVAGFKSIGVWYFYSATNKHQVVCSTFVCQVVNPEKLDIHKNPASKENIIEANWLTKEQILALKDPSINQSLAKLIKQLE